MLNNLTTGGLQLQLCVLTSNLHNIHQGGPQASSALRKEGFDHLIIGVTGCAMDDDVSDYINAGADLVIGKPLTMRAIDCVLTHIHEHGPHSPQGMKLVEEDDELHWVARSPK